MSLGLFEAPCSRRVYCLHDNDYLGSCRRGGCWREYKAGHARLRKLRDRQVLRKTLREEGV